MHEITESVGGRDELGTALAEVIVSDLELLEVRDVALVAQLDRAALCHLIHVDPQITQEVEVLRLDDKLKAIVAYLVDAEVEDLEVRQPGALGDVLRAFCIDVIAADIDLANVP